MLKQTKTLQQCNDESETLRNSISSLPLIEVPNPVHLIVECYGRMDNAFVSIRL